MIKIWVLTGDKLETAINIGYATALLGTEMEPLHRISQDELTLPRDDPSKMSPLENAIQTAMDLIAAQVSVQCCLLLVMGTRLLPRR